MATASAWKEGGSQLPPPYLTWSSRKNRSQGSHMGAGEIYPDLSLNLASLNNGVLYSMRAQVCFPGALISPHKPLTPYKPSTALEPEPHFDFCCYLTKSKRPPSPPRKTVRLRPLLKAKVSARHCFWQGTSSEENPTWAVSPRFTFPKGQRPLSEIQDAVCVWFTFLISQRSRKLSYTSAFWTPEPLFLHKYLIGQLSKCYFPEPPLAPLLEFSGRLVGETLVRVLFSIFLLFWEAYTLCITKTMAQLCLTLYFDCWGENKVINVYVDVCSEVCRMRLSVSLTSQGAGGTLSSPSPKSSREFKHKPICERIFCLSVIHFSLGLSSQTSGVLLAFKLACVSISLTDRLSIVKGVWCSLCGSCVIPGSHVLTWGRGGGETGNYSNIYRCFGNNSDHISTMALQPLAVGPRTHLRGETVAFFP